MEQEKNQTKKIEWNIIKKTEKNKYFDCKLEKNETTRINEEERKFVSWLAVITNVSRSSQLRYPKVDRNFVDSRGFKDMDDSFKYPLLDELIIKGAIIEIGRKTTAYGGYPQESERYYSYYRVVDITEDKIIVKEITKTQMLHAFDNVGLMKIKQEIIKHIQDCETGLELYNSMTNSIILINIFLKEGKKEGN